MSALTQSVTGWQAGFLEMLPAVETHARIRFRKLPAVTREESVQEAIASAVVSYQRLAAQDRLHVAHPGTIAVNAALHVRNGRHVGGHQDAARDVMSAVCQRRRGVRVHSYHTPAAVGDCAGWRQVAIADRKASVPDLVAFRIDFAHWLDSQGPRDRKIILTLASGERTQAVAQQFGLTEGRLSQLRRKFERDWHRLQCEPIDIVRAA